MAIDQEKIEYHIKGLLEALGEDPNREGLLETPQRVAKMFGEVFAGINYTNEQIATMFDKTFQDELELKSQQDMVIVKDISAFSYCEHHLALMYDMKIAVGYVPNGKVIGLSKIARIVDMVCKRLQLQERIGSDIAQIITMVTNSDDVAVAITASHSCMTARGINNVSATTVTNTWRGRFQDDSSCQLKFLMEIRGD